MFKNYTFIWVGSLDYQFVTELPVSHMSPFSASSILHSSLRTKLMYNFSQCPGIRNPKQETSTHLLQLRRSLTSSSRTWSFTSLLLILFLHLIVYSYPFPRSTLAHWEYQSLKQGLYRWSVCFFFLSKKLEGKSLLCEHINIQENFLFH